MFEGIPGNQDVMRQLEASARQGNISHAYLFHGKSGVFKSTTALRFAEALLCEQANGLPLPCGQCPGCRLAAAGTHPDLTIVSRLLDHGYGTQASRRLSADKAPKTISVETVRAVKGDIMVRPFRASRKIYIFFEADRMTVSAQNSLLKILEEPPSYAVLILVTDRREALLDTVLSRCVPVAFHPLAADEIANHLIARYPKHRENAALAAQLSGGSAKSALAFLENKKALQQRTDFFETLSQIFCGKPADLLDAYLYFDKNKNDFDQLLSLFQLALRDMILLKSGCGNLIINQDAKALLESCARGHTMRRLLEISNRLSQAEQYRASNANYHLIISQLLLHCAQEDHYGGSSRRAV